MALQSDAIFDKIRARLEKIDPANRTNEHVYRFQIQQNGATVKTWILDLKNVKVFVGEDPAVEATLIISDADMFGVGSGTIPVDDLLKQDRVDVEGNMETILKLAPFIQSL